VLDDVQRLKLCLASPHFFPTYGGAQLRYLRYLPGLRERGIDTWVATGTPLLEERTEADADQAWYRHPLGEALAPERIDGTLVRRVRLPDRKGLRRSLIFYRSVVKLCREPELRPDAVQFVSNLRARAIPWLLQLRRMGIPTLYSVSQFPTWPFKPRKRVHRRFVYKTLYNTLDCLVTNSDPLHDFLRGIGVTTRIEMIPNGVNLTRFHPSRDPAARRALRKSLGIGEDDLVVATVGAVIPRKGHDRLLAAWGPLAKRFPEARLLLVGPRADQHDPKLEAFGQRLEHLAQASGAADRIHFVGMAEDVENYLRAADVFVLASQREGMPNSVLEAMATGLPAVLTRFIGFSERIGRPDEHYLLSEPDAGALAAAIGALLEKPDLRRSLDENARRWVARTLDSERSLDRYAALYRELARS
jgi:glycosyltransferase involved in cell wall biosynthesis